ncbi:major capsid protein P2 [Cellvibrio sp. QJXJ]|uniref:major capsid protein P2 n=1 Tax=Cellvibrio sp. QJXJ TaxID=2964606 RepID=UPI0021C34D58|nr:major capsid protein P2 [Cellvibrio sp. QJXJ]UUA73553.1 major capsid protein P2 [Cellvibrio sp. QJXJ]
MARIREPIYLIENATAGQRCLIQPSVGRTWLDFHIEHGGLTLAQMTNIRVILVSPERSITLMEFKNGTELNELNKRYGRKVAAGTLSFYFRKPEMENEAQSMATALGTQGLMAIRVEFDIATGTTPVIKAWGRKVANRAVSAGLLPYIVNHNVGGQAQGVNHYDSIEKRDRIIAIHALNDKITAMQLKVDDAVVFDLTRAQGEFDESVGGRVPYGATYGACIDFTTAGVLDEALIMQAQGYQAQQMRLSVTLDAAAATTTRYLVEYLSTWASIAGSNTRAAA